VNSEQSVVFVIDDDPSMRESLESLLRSVGHAAQAFGSTQEFLLSERPDVPGCLVLDVRLPGRSGLEFQRELTRSGIELPIVFITGHGDVPMSVTAMKAGAIEFLTKPFRDQDFLDAVHRGIDLDRGRRAESAILAELRQRFDSLTPREREVMALVAAGRLNKQIAAELDLSEITVKVHRAQVMRKMRANSLPDLVRIADRLAADTTKP
jgi:FixJ family two-component response regulator